MVATPDDVDVWIGLDVGKDTHFAEVLDDAGDQMHARPVDNDEADLETLLDRASDHGTPALVTDQPGSIAQLAIAIAARRDVPVAYVPRLVMRRAADLYPGEAKTDRRDLLAAYPTPAALRAAGRTRITGKLRRRSPRIAGKTTDAVMTALDAQTVTLPAEATVGRVTAELAGELDRLHHRRDTLASEIEEVFLAHPFGQLLVTMPGIGPRTGARILAEIGDGSRFADGAKLASYAGLAPVVRQSGRSLNGAAQSRRGNHRLKNAMFLAAFASLRSPDSKTFYDRKRAEGKRHNAALICLARRCNVILAMLRTRQPYQPTTPATSHADHHIAA